MSETTESPKGQKAPGSTQKNPRRVSASSLDEKVSPEDFQGREQEKVNVGIRRVRMTISRIDPWSALKLSFLLSVAIGVMIVIAAIVLWFVLDSMHVWARIEELLVISNSEPLLELGQYMQFDRMIPFAVVVGVIEIVLFTALGTVIALIYNLIAALVGGVHITVTDE